MSKMSHQSITEESSSGRCRDGNSSAATGYMASTFGSSCVADDVTETEHELLLSCGKIEDNVQLMTFK